MNNNQYLIIEFRGATILKRYTVEFDTIEEVIDFMRRTIPTNRAECYKIGPNCVTHNDFP
jgi:hypothetical protein